MGQYYKPIVLKEDFKNESYPCKAYLKSYDFGDGAKLMEHSIIGNQMVETFAQLIHVENKNGFNDCVVVWCGDYGDNINDMDLYSMADGCNIYKELKNHLAETTLPYRYILNYDKAEYVDMYRVRDNDLYIHPLPILTSYGNGRGGGDYYGTDMDKVGTWAFNHIGVANEVPNDFTELKVNFSEDI